MKKKHIRIIIAIAIFCGLFFKQIFAWIVGIFMIVFSWIASIFMIVFVIIILCLELFISKLPVNETDRNEPIDNILDEMVINQCKGLRNADYIERGEDDNLTNWVTLDFANLPGVRVGHIYQGLHQENKNGSLGSRECVRITFCLEADKERDGVCYFFKYFDLTNTLYMEKAIKEEISIRESPTMENDYHYILEEILISQWIETGNSQFTANDLGELRIVSDIPYAYTGQLDSGPIEEIITEEDGREERYSVWLNNDRLLCVQKGGRFQTRIKESSKACDLEDMLILNDDFYLWLKTSGQATGNLERIPESREKGMENTQLMLQNCPVEEMEKMLPACEFYLEPGYLHIRFPYWNWESENEGWERNGDELWRGWLNLKTEDIEGFLKVEKW